MNKFLSYRGPLDDARVCDSCSEVELKQIETRTSSESPV
jgi:hypothetical protein